MKSSFQRVRLLIERTLYCSHVGVQMQTACELLCDFVMEPECKNWRERALRSQTPGLQHKGVSEIASLIFQQVVNSDFEFGLSFLQKLRLADVWFRSFVWFLDFVLMNRNNAFSLGKYLGSVILKNVIVFGWKYLLFLKSILKIQCISNFKRQVSENLKSKSNTFLLRLRWISANTFLIYSCQLDSWSHYS